jgi:hypothetical protein
MKNLSHIQGKLVILKRERNSLNGNPRYLAAIVDQSGNGFTFKTRPDSMMAYSLRNYEGKEVVATLGTHYGTCTLASIAEKPSWI